MQRSTPRFGAWLVLALSVLGVGMSAGAVWAGQAPAPLPVVGHHPTTTTTAPRTPPSTSPASTTTVVRVTAAGPFVPEPEYSAIVGVVPAADIRIVNGVDRSPPGSTKGLIAALSSLETLGFTPAEAAIVGFGRFPVAGPATWTDDWLEPRFNPDGSFRFHLGNDIDAACGTPIRAAAAGTLKQGSDPAGGISAEIIEPDGSFVYMAHLAGYAPGTDSGEEVEVGDVIGYVGQTGDATGCHLDFQINPRGGAPVDPKPFLDAWAAQAETAAPLLVGELRANDGLPPLS